LNFWIFRIGDFSRRIYFYQIDEPVDPATEVTGTIEFHNLREDHPIGMKSSNQGRKPLE